MAKEYIERDAICYQLEKQESIDGQPRAIRRARRIVADFPAADVRSVDKLTINAIMLLETCPEVINELAERICTKLDDAVLNGYAGGRE